LERCTLFTYRGFATQASQSRTPVVDWEEE